MKTLVAAIIGLVQIATSIPAASLDDDAQLEQALGSAIKRLSAEEPVVGP